MKTWYTMTKPNAAQGQVADEATGRTVAVTYDPKDAPLIAAAPELLAELKTAQNALRRALPYLPADTEAIHTGECLDAIAAVIAKASL